MTRTADDRRPLLEQHRTGHATVDDVLQRIDHAAVAGLGYAQVDLHRHQRCGFPEVIFCEGKTPEWIEGVVRRLVEAGQDCLATRVNAEQAAHLAQTFPQADQDRLGRTFYLPASGNRARVGQVIVLTAGTSDLPGAQEAVVTAQPLGSNVKLLADSAVPGLPRLLPHRAHFA